MQRDMDLVRKILFFIEENYVAGGPEIPVSIDGYLDSVVYEHCILMKNDGLIGKILDTSALESRSCNVGNDNITAPFPPCVDNGITYHNFAETVESIHDVFLV